MSGYGKPCANDPKHGPAIVGIDPPPGHGHESWWVCFECFERSLERKSQ